MCADRHTEPDTDNLESFLELPHCNQNPIYVFLFRESHGLSPNLPTHVSVSDLYIPRVGPHISCSRIGRSIVGISKSLTGPWMWKFGLWPSNFFLGTFVLPFSVLVLCSAAFTLHSFFSRGEWDWGTMSWPDVNPVDEELDIVHEGGDHGLPELPLHLLLLATVIF